MNWFFYWLNDNRSLLVDAIIVFSIMALIGAYVINEVVMFIGLSLMAILGIIITISDIYVEEHSRPIKK